MLGEYNKKCLLCGRDFKSKTYRHKFCCRAHYMKYYRKKVTKEEKAYPSYKCSECGKKQNLGFSPKYEATKWMEYACPYCGYKPFDIQKSDL